MAQQSVLVTGATSGIGKAAAMELARRGYLVFATGRQLPVLEAMCAAHGSDNLVPLQLDITSADDIAQAAAAVEQRTGGRGLDVLINNAGFAVFGPLLELSDEAVRRQFNVNVFGTLAVTRAFASAMVRRGSGRIINVSSIGGRLVFPFDGIYHATKFALEAMSDALRIELAPHGVRVVLIEPGAIRTEFLEAADRSAITAQGSESPFAEATAVFEHLVLQTYEAAPGPQVVVRDIVKAVEAPRPRARYVMPFRDRAFVFLYEHILPTRVMDAIYLQLLKYGVQQGRKRAQQRGAGLAAGQGTGS